MFTVPCGCVFDDDMLVYRCEKHSPPARTNALAWTFGGLVMLCGYVLLLGLVFGFW